MALCALREEAQRSGDLKLDRRARALLLVGRDGLKRREAAKECELSTRTVFRCQEYFGNAGAEGLRAIPQSGRPPRLSTEQRQELATVIEGGPEAAGLDTGIWTSPIIAKLVGTRFGVKLSPQRVRALLHELGFSVQYPKKQLSKTDVARQGQWLAETYPAIRKRAETEGGTLFLKTSASSSSPEAAVKPGHRWVRGSWSKANQAGGQ